MHIDAAHPFGDGDGVDAADEDLCEADPLEGLDASTRDALTTATVRRGGASAGIPRSSATAAPVTPTRCM